LLPIFSFIAVAKQNSVMNPEEKRLNRIGKRLRLYIEKCICCCCYHLEKITTEELFVSVKLVCFFHLLLLAFFSLTFVTKKKRKQAQVYSNSYRQQNKFFEQIHIHPGIFTSPSTLYWYNSLLYFERIQWRTFTREYRKTIQHFVSGSISEENRNFLVFIRELVVVVSDVEVFCCDIHSFHTSFKLIVVPFRK
jgi:hypothetical protein